MIRSFIHKGLRDLFESGRSAKVPPPLRARCAEILDILDHATQLGDVNTPGSYFHKLQATGRYAVSVNGPWRVTFEWAQPDVYRVDLEQYH